MKSLGSNQLRLRPKTTLLLCAICFLSPAMAKAGDPSAIVTPSQYCATVSGCEILGVNESGVAAGLAISVKYCMNGNFGNAFGDVIVDTNSHLTHYIFQNAGVLQSVTNLYPSTLCTILP